MTDARRNRQVFEQLCEFYRVALPVECGSERASVERQASLSPQPELASMPTVDDFWAVTGETSDQPSVTESTTTRKCEPMSVDDFWEAMLPKKTPDVEEDSREALAKLDTQDRGAKRQRLAPAPEKQEHDSYAPPPSTEEAAIDEDNPSTSRRQRRSARVSGRAGKKKREWWKATDTPEKPSIGA